MFLGLRSYCDVPNVNDAIKFDTLPQAKARIQFWNDIRLNDIELICRNDDNEIVGILDAKNECKPNRPAKYETHNED